MKKFYLFLCLVFLVAPLWADDDDLTPEPLSQAAREYESFFQTEKLDPMNYVVWKLYVYGTMTPLDGYTKSPNMLLAELTTVPKDNYRVIISINQLYNFMQTIPQAGDVIVINGTVRFRNDKHLFRSRNTDHYFRDVYLYAEGGKALTEHFTLPFFASMTPTVTAQGVSLK